MPRRVKVVYRIIRSIYKQIIATGSRPAIHNVIRIDKPSHFRIIIPAVEVVQSRFDVVIISAVAQGVDRAEGGGSRAVGAEQLTEWAIGILDNAVAVRIQQSEHVAAEIAEVIHRRAATGHAVGAAVRVIGEVDWRARVGLLGEHLRAVQRVAGRNAVHRLFRADPVGVALCTRAGASRRGRKDILRQENEVVMYQQASPL